MGEMRIAYKMLVQGQTPLGIGVEGMIILERIGMFQLESCVSEQASVVSFCEYSNKPLGSMKKKML
jgi:hypothetical protein